MNFYLSTTKDKMKYNFIILYFRVYLSNPQNDETIGVCLNMVSLIKGDCINHVYLQYIHVHIVVKIVGIHC